MTVSVSSATKYGHQCMGGCDGPCGSPRIELQACKGVQQRHTRVLISEAASINVLRPPDAPAPLPSWKFKLMSRVRRPVKSASLFASTAAPRSKICVSQSVRCCRLGRRLNQLHRASAPWSPTWQSVRFRLRKLGMVDASGHASRNFLTRMPRKVPVNILPHNLRASRLDSLTSEDASCSCCMTS